LQASVGCLSSRTGIALSAFFGYIGSIAKRYLSNIDISTRTCQMTIGAMIVTVGELPDSTAHWDKLQAGFRARFCTITV
jgi:hypothetical protein